MLRFLLTTGLLTLTSLTLTPLGANEWSVPLAGNAYRTAPAPGGLPIDRNGFLTLSDPTEIHSVYFRVDRPGKIGLAIHGRANERQSTLQTVINDQTFRATLLNEPAKRYSLGEIEISEAGYVEVKLRHDRSEGAAVVKIDQLIVTSNVEDMRLDFVKSNDGNMFYWGRRGPSVHLGYQLPKDTNLTYAYSEVMVPVGQDPIGSYFMANGFGEGYFGFQVNSETERRVLFSVWSPFKTDNPSEIPASDRVLTTAKGAGVVVRDFGNEGSGGQSFLVYPWKAGNTYRFLTEIKPDGNGNTEYTSWFADKASNEWRLIATFRRPKTDKHMTGFHSFLESFSPSYGHILRRAQYANQWVVDVDGKWHSIDRARFTADATARGGHRLDYAGGSEGGHFFLQNCGFFAEPTELDQIFELEAAQSTHPEIDFTKLPRS